ncbi:MAG: hypothetical protein SA339_09750 [Methanomassiliicoccus sp.]|nr:hypothetical protein [Methanomassiliicoccus sp.]
MTRNHGVQGVIESAEADTLMHLRYLKNAILRGLQFTLVIILIDIINVTTTTLEGGSAQFIRQTLNISPNPVLLIGLIASAIIQAYLLMQIRANYEQIKQIGKNPDTWENGQKSITDINYDIVKAINISLKVWPLIAILFVLYFLGCLSMLVDLILGIQTGITLSSSTALNLTTVIISAYFFITQTNNWRVQRKRMRKLEKMERVVSDELHI